MKSSRENLASKQHFVHRGRLLFDWASFLFLVSFFVTSEKKEREMGEKSRGKSEGKIE